MIFSCSTAHFDLLALYALPLDRTTTDDGSSEHDGSHKESLCQRVAVSLSDTWKDSWIDRALD